MPAAAALKSKQQYNDRFCKLLDSHERAFLVHADNVGSRQFMDIRTVRAAARLTPPLRKPSPPFFLGFSGRARPRALSARRARADLRVSIPLHHPRPSAPSLIS